MEHDSSTTVNHSNLNYSFMKFQEQYRNLCQNISEEKRGGLIKAVKKANSFLFEYLAFVDNNKLRAEFMKVLKKIKDDLNDDDDFTYLCKQGKHKTQDQVILYNQKYYYYLIRILKLVGLFGDELSKTFMPNTSDRIKLLKYSNNNSFFEQFTVYKSKTATRISEFNIKEFKHSVSYFIGFYFAYYLFIDEQSRWLCENLYSNILNVFLTKDVLKLVIKKSKELSEENTKELNMIDSKLHEGLNHIFFRCNYSYSAYNVMPKLAQKLLVDRTAI